ncbi:MAG: tRNA pseudouridine(38-40) synthase TruA [Prevotellaceae bacterium]|jgi:tRNA pseudouridine38-40 synthase|nr:tRNA pseudouridine(38-40) synthase TruA [Prevotellaceae bacterium]
MRYFVCLSYKGTHYHGWQVQENAPSVQAELHRALSLLLGEPVVVVGAGRTDTGVHARRYVAHFDSTRNLQNDKMRRIHQVNAILPPDICVYDIFPVHDTAHARFDAVERTYKYYIHTAPNPFLLDFSVYVPYPLDVEAMNAAAATMLKYDDFTSFAKLHGNNKTNLCKLTKAGWEKTDSGLVFTISANRFLRNMVRAIVGTLLDVGRGKTPIDDFVRIIERKERRASGASAPAKGLFLEQICYNYVKNK